ncbi:GTP-binding protein [Leucobacter sp. HY1908]
MAEHVILFAGPMGAGKTTAIQSLSDIEVVSTEAFNTDHSVSAKPTTTVALDYGEIGINPGEKIRLYGVPGQRRFDFMWAILKERAFGLMLLVNADAPNLAQGVREHLEAFEDVVERGGAVVGITRSDVHGANVMQQVQRVVADAFPGRATPVFEVDARDTVQMRVMLMTLIADVETRESMKGRM